MNIKKIGLTALAGSMVALSAVAGELTVTGSANMTYSSYDGNQDATDIVSGIGMENAVFATGSTELDNGFVVSLTQGINASDSTYLSVNMGDLGTLEYVQDDSGAGLEKLDDLTPSAYEEVSDGLDGTATTGTYTIAKYAQESGFGYTNTVGGATVYVGYTDGQSGAATGDGAVDTGTSTNSSSSIGVVFPVADTGLSVFGGLGTMGQADGKEIDSEIIGATYAFGPVSVGYQVNTNDDSDAAVKDLETTSASIAFNINENMAISYGIQDTDNGSATDQEASGFSASYTMGALSLKAYKNEVDNLAHASGNTSEKTEISLSVAF
ncbi:porin [Candidatus Pelagibacter ubique]|nr:porin [Candidatus Pelagibacter ubique]